MSDKKSIASQDESNRLTDIVNRMKDACDECGLKLELDINALLKEAREINPSLAYSLEEEFSILRAKARYGTSHSAYLKTQVIQKKFDERTDSEI